MDPTGGAGVAADVRACVAHGCQVRPVLTAVTEQDDEAGVRGLRPTDPQTIAATLRAALRGPPPAVAVKTGMLGGAAAVLTVAEALREAPDLPLVVDPVIWAGAGGRLLDDPGLEAVTAELAPLATLITPNLPEAARLLGADPDDPPPAAEAARALRERGWRAVLVKGGHARSGGDVVDVLASAAGRRRFARQRVPLGTVRGTGCTLAAAIACRLAHGMSLEQAVGSSGQWLHALLLHAAAAGSHRLDPSARDPAGVATALPPLEAWE